MKMIWVLLTVFISYAWSTPLKIKVVTEVAPPFQYVENGKVVDGFAYDVFKELKKRINFEGEPEVYPWSRAYSMAQGDSNVMIFSITRTPEREALFKWVDTLYILDDHLWALRSSEATKNMTTVEELRKLKTGCQRDDQQYLHLKNWGLEEGKGLVIVPTWDQAIQMLYANRLDFVMGSRLMLVSRIKFLKLDPTLVEMRIHLGQMGRGLYFAFSKKTSDRVVNQFKKAFREIHADGTFARLRSKWLMLKDNYSDYQKALDYLYRWFRFGSK